MQILVGVAMMLGVVGFAWLLVSRWDRLGEPLQWVLYFPTLALSFLATGMVFTIIQLLRDEEGFLAAMVKSGVMAGVFIGLAFALAPRAPARFGWAVYLCMVGWMLLVLFVLGMKAVGLAGLPLFPRTEDAGWSEVDSLEAGQAVVWLIVGTITFRKQLAEAKAGR